MPVLADPCHLVIGQTETVDGWIALLKPGAAIAGVTDLIV
jgi:hypothetical protein